jgi:hypothetical protein
VSFLLAIVVGIMVLQAGAATTTGVVDIPTRGVTQRILYTRPDAPVANIVFLPGLFGILDIRDDGSMPSLAGRCAPLARNRDALASRGLALAVVDQTSDLKVRQFADVREVVRHLQSRDHVPTWIVGGSGSTMAAIDFAVEFPRDENLGVVIFSPGNLDASRAARVQRPTLVIYHRDEADTVPVVDALFDALPATPDKERIGLAGGTAGGECGGYHLFIGIDDAFVAAVSNFILRHNTFPAPSIRKQ